MAGALADLGVPVSLTVMRIILPVGISFYTFHAISYVVDVYRGKVEPEPSFVNIALYISFFPHLVAGPIVRAHEFLCPSSALALEIPGDFSFGENMLLILGGLFKKMVIANYPGRPVRRSGLHRPLAILAVRSDHGGLRLRDLDLRRFFRLHRHRDRGRRGCSAIASRRTSTTRTAPR